MSLSAFDGSCKGCFTNEYKNMYIMNKTCIIICLNAPYAHNYKLKVKKY